jgi:hypothetical protein
LIWKKNWRKLGKQILTDMLFDSPQATLVVDKSPTHLDCFSTAIRFRPQRPGSFIDKLELVRQKTFDGRELYDNWPRSENSFLWLNLKQKEWRFQIEEDERTQETSRAQVLAPSAPNPFGLLRDWNHRSSSNHKCTRIYICLLSVEIGFQAHYSCICDLQNDSQSYNIVSFDV